MADSLSIQEYADYIEITYEMGIFRKLTRSFVNDKDFADSITATPVISPQTIDDRGVVQGHTYYYWIQETFGAKNIVVGPISGRLKQYKLIGRGGGLKGSKRNKTWDYDVECPLCGKHVRRNLLRRGYVKPHESGRNYLPAAAAPELWTMSPSYFDANLWNWFFQSETTPAFVFPNIEKDSDWRTPPGQNRWPGCPIFDPAVSETIVMGTPSSAHATSGGYLIAWVYVTIPGALTFAANQGIFPTLSAQDISSLGKGWHRLSYEVVWDALNPIVLTLGDATSVGQVIFGGAMLTNLADETTWMIPHRSSGVGVYTTGGMMDLCPECWSGMRKRVPWE